jgi:uracil-DNA glycosylase
LKHKSYVKLNNPITAVTDEIINMLKFMARCGCKGYDPSERTIQILEGWSLSTSGRPRPETLDEIRNDLGDCQRCKLWKGRNNIVFGAGNSHARLVFVGEGPGFDEDRQGEPFVGKAGQLLTKIILAMKLSREEVYICNVIKCRPPENRNPEPDEIKACFPFLKRQLEAISPDCICALGSVATNSFLEKEVFISRVRGRFFDYKGIKVMPTYHPAYLLRNPEKKRDVWEDVQKIMKIIGI